MYFDCRLRVCSRFHDQVFVGWHNNEVWNITPRNRDDIYLAVPYWWIESIEVEGIVPVPIPLFFLNFVGVFMDTNQRLVGYFELVTGLEFFYLFIPFVIGVARWVMRRQEFRYP